MSETNYKPTMADMDRALGEMLDENEALKAELKQVYDQLYNLRDILRSITLDKSFPPELRARVANNVLDFARRVRGAR
jgi:predicted nuclease with TOPRIM domain